MNRTFTSFVATIAASAALAAALTGAPRVAGAGDAPASYAALSESGVAATSGRGTRQRRAAPEATTAAAAQAEVAVLTRRGTRMRPVVDAEAPEAQMAEAIDRTPTLTRRGVRMRPAPSETLVTAMAEAEGPALR